MELARWPPPDRELRVFIGEDCYELRDDSEPVALLGDPAYSAVVECAARDGRWEFARLPRGDTEATIGTAVVARYDSNVLPGGKIEMLDGDRFRLRPPVVGETWRVRGVLEVTRTAGPYRIRFGERAGEVRQLPLLTTFAFHAMLVERSRSGGGDPGAGMSV